MHIIDNYADLSIGKYIDILNAVTDGDADDLDKQVATLAILADVTEDDILALPLSEYADLVARASFLAAEDKGKHAVAKSYKLAGLELIPAADAAELTAGQFIDFQTLTSDGALEPRLPEILSCLLVPRGKSYGKGYDIADVQDAVRNHLSVTDALSLLAFFLASSEKLLLRFLTSSERAAAKMKDRTAKTMIVEKIRQTRATLLRAAGAGSQQ
ncbi:MAG: hypothetical protein IJ654_05370 [Bacteroidales bacterium]|nr:hypothetical protein [Bacteroidales bacterium]